MLLSDFIDCQYRYFFYNVRFITPTIYQNIHTYKHTRHLTWIQAHSLFHTQPPLQSRICIRPSLRQKGYKIHLSCHFSVRTHCNSTLQQKLGVITSLQDPYLGTTSNVNLSPTQSPNIKILFKRDSSSSARTGLFTVGDRGFINTL